jgi:hypothetical protein
MANNLYNNPNYNRSQPRQPGGMAAYLLGMGEMPAPHPEEIAVAMFNRAMDNPDENIDPHL